MAFDSAVPVEGIEEDSVVVKRPANDNSQAQKTIKDHLGNLTRKRGGVDAKNEPPVKPGEKRDDEKGTST